MHHPLEVSMGNNSQAALRGDITFQRNAVSAVSITICKKEGLEEQPASSFLY